MRLKDVLSKPERWVKNGGYFLLDINNPDFCCCLVTARYKTLVDPSGKESFEYLKKIANAIKFLYPQFERGNDDYSIIVDFNDSASTTFEMIQKVIEKSGL